MKEFFSKKWVFLSSIIASAVFVIGLLVMVCVPQFYIGSYKTTAEEDGFTLTNAIDGAYWLISKMENYCVGYEHIEYNGKHYYMVYHS